MGKLKTMAKKTTKAAKKVTPTESGAMSLAKKLKEAVEKDNNISQFRTARIVRMTNQIIRSLG